MSDAPTKKCPACAELILAEAKKCKHCGEILDLQMRDIDQLKTQLKQAGPVYMNAANGGAGGGLRYFNYGIHIFMTLLTAGLWLVVYIPLYIFRDKNRYV